MSRETASFGTYVNHPIPVRISRGEKQKYTPILIRKIGINPDAYCSVERLITSIEAAAHARSKFLYPHARRAWRATQPRRIERNDAVHEALRVGLFALPASASRGHISSACCKRFAHTHTSFILLPPTTKQ